jgi:hypothetical protein
MENGRRRSADMGLDSRFQVLWLRPGGYLASATQLCGRQETGTRISPRLLKRARHLMLIPGRI